jgi:transporter family protein
MHYLVWALVALLAYSVFTPVAKLATGSAPATVVALVANSMLALGAAVVVLTQDIPVVEYVTGDAGPFMLGAGVFLTVGILAYYQALAAGPVSVVTPTFGMFLVVSAALGVVFLGEPFSLQKAVGIALAAAGVYLTTTA